MLTVIYYGYIITDSWLYAQAFDQVEQIERLGFVAYSVADFYGLPQYLYHHTGQGRKYTVAESFDILMVRKLFPSYRKNTRNGEKCICFQK